MVELLPDIRELQAVAFLAVGIPHCDGDDGCTKGREAEDEHRGGVTGVGLVGATYEHGDNGSTEILDEEDHRISCT